MEEYALTSAEAVYEDPGEQAPKVFVAEGRGFNDGYAFHWWDFKN